MQQDATASVWFHICEHTPDARVGIRHSNSAAVSVLWIACVQRLFDQNVIVESNDNPSTKVVLDPWPKALMDGMGLRSTNAQSSNDVASGQNFGQPDSSQVLLPRR